MTGMRKSYLRPTPTLTRDRDEGRPKCHNDLGRMAIDHLDETTMPDLELLEALNHMCASCPLIETCHAENKGAQWLRNLRREFGGRKRAACGTRTGARKHRRLGETPCQGCREAENAARRESARNTRARRREEAAA